MVKVKESAHQDEESEGQNPMVVEKESQGFYGFMGQ